MILKSPVILGTVIHKLPEAAHQKMFHHQPNRGGIINHHAGKRKLRATTAKIHRGKGSGNNKPGQLLIGAEPSQDTIPFPAPRNHFLLGDVRAQMPTRLQSKLGYPHV